MEAIIIIVIELFVFEHPICEIFQFDGACTDINIIIFENSSGELLHNMMYRSCFNFDIVAANFQFQCHGPFVVLFFVHFFDDVGSCLAFQPFRGTIVIVEGKFSILYILISNSIGANTLEPPALKFALIGDQEGANFFIDKILIIEYIFEVFFGIVVKLNRWKIYHGEKLTKGDSFILGVASREELKQQFNFSFFRSLEYFD